MTDKKSYGEVYSRSALTGGFDADDPAASMQGQAEYRRRQEEDEKRRAALKQAMQNASSPESRRAYERLGEGVAIVVLAFLVWSAFGMGIYFTIPALGKVLGLGDSSLPFQQFYESINGAFAVVVAISMAVALIALRRKSRKRFWQANVALVAVSGAILML